MEELIEISIIPGKSLTSAELKTALEAHNIDGVTLEIRHPQKPLLSSGMEFLYVACAVRILNELLKTLTAYLQAREAATQNQKISIRIERSDGISKTVELQGSEALQLLQNGAVLHILESSSRSAEEKSISRQI